MSASPEQRLWQNVLLAVVSDLKSAGNNSYHDRQLAIRWVGAFPSREFRMVCDLAGINSQRTHRVLTDLVERGAGRPITGRHSEPVAPLAQIGMACLGSRRSDARARV